MGSGCLPRLRRSPRPSVLRSAVLVGADGSLVGVVDLGRGRGQPDRPTGPALAGDAVIEALDSSTRRLVAAARWGGVHASVGDVRTGTPRPKYRRSAQQRRHRGARTLASCSTHGLLNWPPGSWIAVQMPGNFETPSPDRGAARWPGGNNSQKHCGISRFGAGRWSTHRRAYRLVADRTPGAPSTPGRPPTYTSSPASIRCWTGSAAPRCCR